MLASCRYWAPTNESRAPEPRLLALPLDEPTRHAARPVAEGRGQHGQRSLLEGFFRERACGGDTRFETQAADGGLDGHVRVLEADELALLVALTVAALVWAVIVLGRARSQAFMPSQRVRRSSKLRSSVSSIWAYSVGAPVVAG
jgi:hypothetical protein